jgi:hypothetical protein
MVTFHIYRYIRLSYVNLSQLAQLLSNTIAGIVIAFQIHAITKKL